MKAGYKEVICMVDASGAMTGKPADIVKQVNSFLDSLADDSGEIRVFLYLFGEEITALAEKKTPKGCTRLSNRNYKPKGNIALFECACKTIDDIGVRLSETQEDQRPEKVTIALLAEGVDNCSKKCTLANLTQRIEHQSEVYSWEFLFLREQLDKFRKIRKKFDPPAESGQKPAKKRGKAIESVDAAEPVEPSESVEAKKAFAVTDKSKSEV